MRGRSIAGRRGAGPTQQHSVRLPAEAWEEIQRQADLQQMTAAELMRAALLERFTTRPARAADAE